MRIDNTRIQFSNFGQNDRMALQELKDQFNSIDTSSQNPQVQLKKADAVINGTKLLMESSDKSVAQDATALNKNAIDAKNEIETNINPTTTTPASGGSAQETSGISITTPENPLASIMKTPAFRMLEKAEKLNQLVKTAPTTNYTALSPAQKLEIDTTVRQVVQYAVMMADQG